MVSSWIRAKFTTFSRIDSQPPRSIAWIGAKLAEQGISHISRKLGLICRYLYVNSVPFRSNENGNQAQNTIEILFVATRKDFRTLGMAINGVLGSCNQEITKVNIVVPDKDTEQCASAVSPCKSNLIHIISESTLVDDLLIKAIFSRFGTRGGWVLQQVLKLEFIRRSDSAGVLIVDADTVLLKKRDWLNSDEIQTLMPSWEYHTPYFTFLRALPPFKSNSDFLPKFSFVAHHMLMQPTIVREIYEACGWQGSEELVHFLCEFSTSGSESPFSIDYELYGHYLLLNHPDKVILAKWGNVSSRYSDELSMELLKIKYPSFASVSLHSYLN